jgi:anti-sigma regulatory factor (Ser/Thr protein kinase)
VSVSYVVAKDVLEIVVEDQGTGMEVEEQDVSDGPVAIPVESGMGLAIIRTIVDDLEIRPGAGDRGTVVRMSKRLVPGES